MRAKLTIVRTLSSALSEREWERGASTSPATPAVELPLVRLSTAQRAKPSICGAEQSAVYSKTRPQKPQSSSDFFLGLAEGPAAHAYSPHRSLWSRLRTRHRAVSAAASVAVVGVGALLLASPAFALRAGTKVATEITPTSATLNGTVNDEEEALTECFFEYGETKTYGHIAPCEHPDAAEVPVDSNKHSVHANVEGLTRNADYHFRIVVANASGTLREIDETFSTRVGHFYSTSFGTATSVPPNPYPLLDPFSVAVDESTGDLYVSELGHSEQQTVTVDATAGTFTLAFEGQATAPLPYDATSGEVQHALAALTTIGTGNVVVTGSPGDWAVEFNGALAATDLAELSADSTELTGASHTATVATTAEGGGARIEKFTSAGEFLLMFGGDVNATTHADLCTKEEVCQPATSGTAPGSFQGSFIHERGERTGAALYLAVDNSPGGGGDLYAGDAGDNLISKFDSAGHLIASWGHDGQLDGTTARDGPFSTKTGLEGIAVEADGTLVAAAFFETVYEFDPAGSWLATAETFPTHSSFQGIAVDAAGDVYSIDSSGSSDVVGVHLQLSPGAVLHEQLIETVGGRASALASDPLTRQLYAAEGGQIALYPPSCEVNCTAFETFGAGHHLEGGSPGLAIDAATGTLYATDPAAHSLAVFAASPYLPAAAPSPAQPLASTEELLKGTLNPAAAGPITACSFEYVPQAAFEDQVQTIALSAATGTANLTRGSRQLIGLATSTGAFAPGEPIEGPGIPNGTTVTALGPAGDHGATLTLSAPATASALAVHLSARPTAGTFTLSLGAHTSEPIPFNAGEQKIFEEVEPFLGASVEGRTVRGPHGGPYELEFLSAAKFPLLAAHPSGLTPPASTATVSSNGAGGRWSAGAATASCQQPLPIAAEEDNPVTAKPTTLAPGTAYRFRLTAANAAGSYTSFPEAFTTLPLAPAVGSTSATEVFAETAQIDAQVDPGGGEAAYPTSYRVEYLTSEHLERNAEEGQEEFAGAESSPSLTAGPAHTPQSLTAKLEGLHPDTTYHYRVFASNECEPGVQCTARGPAHTLTTLPSAIPPNDPCPNAHVRQQTSAAGLLDCRAYELVSAAHTAGYDVESSLIEGQFPFAAYPEAKAPSGEPRVLYGIHDGGIPGVGEPTNDGVDPYVATRTSTGWSTEYVGIPSTLDPASGPFGSPLLATDRDLDTFAFGGAGLCAPCFGEGIQTGVPLHLPATERPVQGMVPAPGATPPPAATLDGYIAAPLSANGEHLIFGSTSLFARGGNNSTGDVSIYDRDLKTGETHVVSNSPTPGEDGPEPLSCLPTPGECHSPGDPNGIAELAISADGSHILLGQKVTEDADHNVYWHLYMDINDSISSIALTPGAAKGVLFDGMTENGAEVFFSSAEHLTGVDTSHTGADLFTWSQQGEEEGQPLTLISTGEAPAGDTGACNPVANSNGEHWNALGSEADCAVLAIGGGGGVAAADGSIYFLSPEKLEASHGAKNRPNLYLAAPGQPPRFVATLEPEDPLVLDALSEAETRHTADLQVTPNGEFAAFPSTLNLAGNGEETAGHTVLYRYDAATEKLTCVSCTLTGLPSEGDSSLASDGQGLAEDGRVFFNSTDPLDAADTDERSDVYEWEEQGAGNCEESSPAFSKAQRVCLALISAGTSSFNSDLLGADSSGTDVYFFTRDKLAEQDENGPTVKIYDAREGGGFPYVPPRADCKASDECHGAASPAPPPIEVGSESGTPHQYEPEPQGCKKGFVKKHGKCVQKHPHKHKGKHHRRGGASKRSKSDSSAPRAKTKHLQRAHHKRGGK
jgi:hypothetical protein